MKMISFVGALVAAFIPAALHAQSESAIPDSSDVGTRWVYVGQTDFSKLYLDKARIVPVDSERADIWVHQVLHVRSAQQGDWLDSSVDHIRVNCKTPTVEGIYSTAWYDRRNLVKTMGDGSLHSLGPTTNSAETAAGLCKAMARVAPVRER